MRISFTPQRSDGSLSVTKAGDVLTINGEDFDFSAIPNGATLPAEAVVSDFVSGPVERTAEGELQLTLVLPHGPSPSEAKAFPSPITVTEDGAIALPGD